MAYDLSILIPSRNEMFLAKTVEELLKNKRGNTEIIVGLDGSWADPVVVDHPDVTILHYSKSLGQRAMTNQLCRLSKAKYVMKIDAHCTVDEGFDVKLMADMQDNWTVVPAMYNLHAFDWQCGKCGNRWYQGPTPTYCLSSDLTKNQGCDSKEFKRVLVFKRRENRKSMFYRFDKNLHFQYHGEYGNRPETRYGIITGYKLSFDPGGVSSSVVSLFTNFARSHFLLCGSNHLWLGENMSMDTVSFSPIDTSGSIGKSKIFRVGDKSQVGGVTTPSVFTDMVNDGNFTASSARNWLNEPSENKSVCKCFVLEEGAASISSFVDSSNPVPAPGSTIDSDIIKELNDILGGDFVYSEKTNTFHNGSVTLSPVQDNGLAHTLSLQGSCFMMTRAKYWELDICEEAHGSWGQQGVEVACKTWLSGGRVVVNKKTWYAHMFRTQGGDFGFPYPLSGSDVEKARQYSRSLFLQGNWPLAKHDLNWLLEKFRPVPDWHDGQPVAPSKKGIIFYTDNQLSLKIAHPVQKQLKKIGLPIVSASLKPMTFGQNVCLPLERGYLTMARQILAALEASTAEIIFFCEHDVLYHSSHFDFTPPSKDVYYYNTNVVKIRLPDGHTLKVTDCKQLSGLCAYRETLLTHYRNRVKKMEENGFTRKNGFEPGTRNIKIGGFDDLAAGEWKSKHPNVDIRHDNNLTENRWSKDKFRNQKYTDGWVEGDETLLDGWDIKKGEFSEFLKKI